MPTRERGLACFIFGMEEEGAPCSPDGGERDSQRPSASSTPPCENCRSTILGEVVDLTYSPRRAIYENAG